MTVRRAAVLLGTPIDDVTLDESIDVIASMIETGRRTGRVHQVATVNVDFAVNATHDERLRAIMRATDLAIPDGMGIVWGAKFVRTPIRERSAGADLLPALAHRAVKDGWRLCLFGGASGVADAAAEVLRAAAVGVDVVVVDAPMVAADGAMDDAVVTQLREVRADVLAVALGNPKQEHWIARYGTAVGIPVAIGLGGTLDFLTGATTRAPGWMQRAGLEWIHRACSEPRRLMGRYAHDLAVFGPALARQAWRGRRRRGRGVVATSQHGEGTTIELAGLERLDNEALAEIVAVQRSVRLAGGVVKVVGSSPAVLADAGRLDAADMLTASP